MTVVLAVDVGTTATKAALLDEHGVLATAACDSRVYFGAQGHVEQDLEEVVASVGTVVRGVLDQGVGQPEALAVTGQGDGLWLRRADGSAPHRAVSWMDARAAAIVDAWRADGTLEAVYRRTGAAMFPGSHGPLLAWFARERPEVLAESAVAGYCVDAVVHRLCGELTVDASDASLPFLDHRTGDYDDVALEACGILGLRALLVPPAKPGTLLTLSADGSGITGLPTGLPVLAAPYDLVSAAFGSGVARAGDGCLILGTTLACEVLTDTGPSAPVDGEAAGMWLATPREGHFLRAMPAMVGTAGFDWLLRLLGIPVERLDDVLGESPVGARGVRALPFLSEAGERAPFVAPGARGALDGLSVATTPSDLVRSLVEGTAMAARSCFEAAGLDGDLYVTGGAAQSAQVAQVFSAVLGRPLTVAPPSTAGIRGAAGFLLDAMGAGTGEPTTTSHVVEPDPDATAAYAEAYGRYTSEVVARRAAWA